MSFTLSEEDTPEMNESQRVARVPFMLDGQAPEGAEPDEEPFDSWQLADEWFQHPPAVVCQIRGCSILP
jgi:hypothetical protein